MLQSSWEPFIFPDMILILILQPNKTKQGRIIQHSTESLLLIARRELKLANLRKTASVCSSCCFRELSRLKGERQCWEQERERERQLWNKEGERVCWRAGERETGLNLRKRERQWQDWDQERETVSYCTQLCLQMLRWYKYTGFSCH